MEIKKNILTIEEELFIKDEEINYLQRENAVLKHYLNKSKNFLKQAHEDLYYFTSNKSKEKIENFLIELESTTEI